MGVRARSWLSPYPCSKGETLYSTYSKGIERDQCIAVVGDPLLSNELPLFPQGWAIPRLSHASAVMLAPSHPTAGAGLLLVSGPGCLCRDSVHVSWGCWSHWMGC